MNKQIDTQVCQLFKNSRAPDVTIDMADYFDFNLNSKEEDIRRVYDFYRTINILFGSKEYDNWLTFKLKADANWAYYKTEKYFKPRAARLRGNVS